METEEAQKMENKPKDIKQYNKEYYEKNKTKFKLYYQERKAEICKRQNEYNKIHKDEIKTKNSNYAKEYRNKHREKLNAYLKEWRINKKTNKNNIN